MRTIRALRMAGVLLLAIPTIAIAQRGRQFKDAWFWGLKGGGLTVVDSGQNYKQAPTIGLEWLITRTHGGLYLSASQSYFKGHSFTLRDPLTADSGFRPIELRNLRRFDAAMMAFPMQRTHFHPYAGIGLSLMQIAQAVPEGVFFDADQLNFALNVIQEERVSITPYFIGGGQWRLRYFSVFGQLTGAPTQRTFLVYNGKPWNFGYEIGIRYNVGTSIGKY